MVSAVPPLRSTMAILLPPGVYATSVDGDLVFLDAHQDEYLCIGRRAAGGLVDQLRTLVRPASELEILLEEQGLILHSPPVLGGADWCPALKIDLDDEPQSAIRRSDIVALAAASLMTWIWLRRLSPARWFQRLANGRSAPGPCAGEDTFALVRRFRRLRPWVPRSGRCLVRSLMLLHFLRLHRRSATLVFGVRTHPFEAHCWLEIDGVVLDDTVEHVGWFTPIARVGHGS